MHGRPRHRAGQAPSPVDKQEQAHAAELCKLMPLFMESNRTCCYSTESMNQNARLLELNPDFLTAWNYRKRAVQHLWELEESDRKRIAQTELDVVVRALRANPKCYGAWYHRKWIIRFGLSSLDAEFLLLKKLLKLDARNFHGWNYRRFVAETKGVAAEEELRFTTDKINENFSNYSAWHNRSALLSEISKRTDTKNSRVQESLEEEYELVKTAFYTDPDDQSGWFYYSWLLGQTIDPVGTHVNGCWPPAESEIAIDLENNTYKLPFNMPRRKKLGALHLPLVLSFSNVVTGVNNRTVSVNVDGNDPLELDWRPVEPWLKHGRKWTADIMQHLPSNSGQYAVNVLVGGVPGIVSVDGQECVSSWKSRFHLLLREISLSEDVSSVGEPVTGTSEVADGSEIWQLNVLDGEIQSCRELLELESNSKWTMLTLARLLLTHASYNSSSRKSHINEARTHFEVLGSLDPTHREYYQHQLSLLSLKEMTEDSSSLRRQYEQSGELLQLKQLSLCSVEFTERFLWIQNLDLSHNQLRSTHGLEALQVLVNLNLRHNRIGSVTALAPLRELPLLEDVDVSFNLIGYHTVDSCRFLCSSKLTNAAAATPDFLKVGERWETKTVFGGLCWRKLNIAGNAAAEDVQFVDSLTRTLAGTEVITDPAYQ